MISFYSDTGLWFNNVYFTLHVIAICMSYVVFFVTFCAAALYLVQDNNLKKKHLGSVFEKLPNLSVLDGIVYRSMGIGFPILTLAIISGLLMQKDVWGFYWSWNSRSVYSVVLWLLYAVILHVRLSSKLRGKKVAILSILAFFVIIFTFFAACGEA